MNFNRIINPSYVTTHVMYKLITKRVLPVKCPRCSWEWDYSGIRTDYVCCAHCRTSVNIRKIINVDASLEDESGIETPNSSPKVAQTNEPPVSGSNG